MKPLDMIRNLRLRNELDRLSSRQLRDLNLERVNVLPGSSIYQHRVWTGL